MKHKALTAAIATALAAPMAAQAVDFSISGQVNRALFIVDQGDHTRAKVANNGASSTRVRVTGSSEMMDGNTAGIHIEYEEGGSTTQGDTTIKLRHANAWFSGGFGKITLGQASEAGDGTVYPDKSGVWGIGVGQLHSSGSTLYGVYFDSLDGGTRLNLVRYDTPVIGLVSGAVSVANDDYVSAKITGDQSVGGTTVSGSLAVNMGASDNADVTTAALGIGLASGITWSVAWASSNSPKVGQETASYVHTVVGYKFGNSSVGVSYYGGNDMDVNGSESTGIGVGAAHLLPKVDAVVYAGVQQHSVDGGDSTNASLDAKGNGDDTVLTIGTKISF